MDQQRPLSHDLRDLAQIETNPDAAQRAIARAQSALKSQSLEPISRHGGSLMRPRNLAALATAAVLMLMAWHFISSGSSSNLAFSQVLEQVAKTKSVQYIERRTYPQRIARGRKEKEEFHVKILGPHLERREAVWNPPVFSPSPNARQVSRVVDIKDIDKRNMITLYTDIKEYSLREDVPYGEIDFYESFRKVSDENSKQISGKEIDGKRTIGFLVETEIEYPKHIEKRNLTWWVDPATKLPLRIESNCRSEKRESKLVKPNPTMPPPAMPVDYDAVISEIVFDAPLDIALFSTTPPTDYADERITNPPLADLSVANVFAIAEVMALVHTEVEKAKTVQYTEHLKSMHEHTRSDEVRKVMILGDHLERQEQQIRIFEKDGTERYREPQQNFQILDMKNEKMLGWFPQKKGYILRDFAAPPPKGKDGKPVPSATFLFSGSLESWIRNVPVDKAKKLPEKTIDGKTVVGFLIEEQHKSPRESIRTQRTYWVDPTSKLPIRIEAKLRTTRQGEKEPEGIVDLTQTHGHGNMDSVFSDIIFDAPLDPKLFSLDPPAGYEQIIPRNAKQK